MDGLERVLTAPNRGSARTRMKAPFTVCPSGRRHAFPRGHDLIPAAPRQIAIGAELKSSGSSSEASGSWASWNSSTSQLALEPISAM